MRRAVAALSLAAGLAAVAGSAAAPAPDASWLAYGHDAQNTNYTPAARLTARVTRFRLAWQAALDGGVTASPLAAPLPGVGLVVFASTSAGNVYALKSDGTVLWERALGTVVAGRGCGTYGINSTAVVDTARGVLYVAAADGNVYALRLVDGADAPGWPVQVVSRPHTEYVWGGLRLLGRTLYVPVASYCDEPDANGVPAEGRLLAYDVTRPAKPPVVFDPVPGTDNLGGIWGWGGVSVAPAGDALYTGVGNAEPDVANGYSDSVVELTPDLSRVLGSNRPASAIPGGDIDLGAAPVLFRPRGCPALLAANAKSGELLVWRQGRLGAGPVARLPLSDGVHPFVGAPAWSPRTQMLYDAGATALKAGKRLVGTIALRVTSRCGLVRRWFQSTGVGAQPQPLVAGDLVAMTGGFGGGFVVSRAGTGVVVWRYATNAPTIAPMISAGGLLIGGDSAGRLYAFRPGRPLPSAG